MTREEFEKKCIEMKPEAGPVQITDEEYGVIETVYTFHPSISETEGKKLEKLEKTKGLMRVGQGMEFGRKWQCYNLYKQLREDEA